MSDWPKVEWGGGPEPYIDRVATDEPFITEPKIVLAHGLVDGVPWTLTSFRIEEPLQPNQPRMGEGRVLELFLGARGDHGGGGHGAWIPKAHHLNMGGSFFGSLPKVSAHVGCVSDQVATVAVELETGDGRTLRLFEREHFPRAFIAFTPTGVPGEVVARDSRGDVLDRWQLFLRRRMGPGSSSGAVAWHLE